MNDRFDEEGRRLPPDLAELDGELSSIRYEERPSFGPELEAELARASRRGWARRPVALRELVAAVAACLVLVGVAVPQARASIVRFVARLQVDHREAPTSGSRTTPAPVRKSPPAVSPEALPSVGGRRDSTTLSAPARPIAGPAVTFPELLDRPGAEMLIRNHYPVALQRAGVGGTVRLRLWVDSAGSVDFVTLGRSSGIPDLDRAALDVAPSFHFRPARRFGSSVGTWVEFDVQFKPAPDSTPATSLPKVTPIPRPEAPDTDLPDLTPEWQRGMVLSAPVPRTAADLLRAAIGDDALIDRLGPIQHILEGEPPAGVAPTRWRVEVGQVLDQAMERDPDNPAPFLALGRLRRMQGLRDEAHALFKRGLERANREGQAVSPALLAALEYELGELQEASWLGSRNLGTVPSTALPEGACAQAPGPSDPTSVSVSVETLIAWNYTCPTALHEVWRTTFRSVAAGSSEDFANMMASFQTAVKARPADVGANVGLLLALADEGRWSDVLDRARRFAAASNGAPDALLLSGLALERLRRPEEAEVQFALAMQSLPAAEVADLEDVRALATPAQEAEYQSLRATDRRAWLDAFWTPLDPILSTAVNERRVEHLARATYAYLRFGSTASDPGQVWMRYGRPDRIRVVGSGPDVRTEFWEYGPGPDITFRRVAPSTDLNLTSEARSYLSDLEQVSPQSYGSAGRLVARLHGQVSRFRGAASAGTEVEVDTEVPQAMAAGAADSLDLSVFQLDTDGHVVSSVMHRVPAKHMPISVQGVGSARVGSIAVELLDRKSGSVAALRAQARLDAPKAGRPSTSDLLVTAPRVPEGWKTMPGRDGLAAETLAGPLSGREVGAYFELYDLPAATKWYRLRAEVRDRTTGAVRSVTIEPAGRASFRQTWDVRPAPAKAVPNFVLVDLSGVPAGSYTLRLVVDMLGAPSPVIAQRDLDLGP